MKFAYLETKKGSKAPGKKIASFFFNARGDFLERSITGMYRSLLFQLLNTYSDLQFIFDDPDIVPLNQTVCPDLNILKELFRKAIMSLSWRSFTCFIDALDECDEQEVQDMVEFFRELAEETTEAGVHFRVCFSSRPYPYIYTGTEVLLVLEKEAGHGDDLSQYVIHRLRIKNPSLFSELKARILEKASGIFMWIVLAVEILNRESNKGSLALRQKLATIPAKLSDLFKSILTRDQHDVDRLLHSILWILYAKRPLSPLEFRHAVWVGELAQGKVDAVLKDDSIETAINLVTSSSKGLAEITASENPTVQFIHESVRDFLIKDNGLREMWPDLGIEWEACAHEKLKICCDTYISLRGAQLVIQQSVPRTNRKDATEKCPFLEYACNHVLYHADAAALAIPQLDFIDGFSSPAKIRSLNHGKTAPDQLYTPDAPLLYILAHQGCDTLVRLQMKRTPVTFTQEFFNHPLFAALEGGHQQSAVALLDLPPTIYDGVDMNERRGNFSSLTRGDRYPGRTLLTWAAQEGRLNLMKVLIRAGADVNEEDGDTKTALRRALYGQSTGAAHFLINNGARVDHPDRDGVTALMSAALYGFNDIVRKLVREGGANVNARDINQSTALLWASWQGNEYTVELLLKEGADIEAWDKSGWTALMWAAAPVGSHGDPCTARLLIQRGAKVEARDNSGRTAVMQASATGHLDTAHVLLDEGHADVNARDARGWTALMIAAFAGQADIIHVLLGKNADCLVRDKSGQTAFSLAKIGGHSSVADLLKPWTERGSIGRTHRD